MRSQKEWPLEKRIFAFKNLWRYILVQHDLYWGLNEIRIEKIVSSWIHLEFSRKRIIMLLSSSSSSVLSPLPLEDMILSFSLSMWLCCLDDLILWNPSHGIVFLWISGKFYLDGYKEMECHPNWSNDKCVVQESPSCRTQWPCRICAGNKVENVSIVQSSIACVHGEWSRFMSRNNMRSFWQVIHAMRWWDKYSRNRSSKLVFNRNRWV